jgi:Ca2+-binding RTX toxin-like protein
MKKQTLVTVLAAAACSALVFAAVALATTIRGTQGDDPALNGTAGADTIIAKKGADGGDAGSGDDYVNAGGGNDEFNGGDGDDRLSGKAGNDVLNGGNGNDLLSGKAGVDKLNGEEGDDHLIGGKDADELNGGPGNDTIKARGDGKAADTTIDCGADTDTVLLGPNDTAAAVVNCESVEQLGGS